MKCFQGDSANDQGPQASSVCLLLTNVLAFMSQDIAVSVNVSFVFDLSEMSVGIILPRVTGILQALTLQHTWIKTG